jgi:hypothetical protein
MRFHPLLLAFSLSLTPAIAAGSDAFDDRLASLEAEVVLQDGVAEDSVGVERVDALRRAGIALRRVADEARRFRCSPERSYVACVLAAEVLADRAIEAETAAAARFAQAMFEGRRDGVDRAAVRAAGQELRGLLSGVERRELAGGDRLPMTPCMEDKRDQLADAAALAGLPRGMEQVVLDRIEAARLLRAEHGGVRQDPSWDEAWAEQIQALEAALDSEDPWWVAQQSAYFDGFVQAWLVDAIGGAEKTWIPGLPPGMRAEDGFVPPLACESDPSPR